MSAVKRVQLLFALLGFVLISESSVASDYDESGDFSDTIGLDDNLGLGEYNEETDDEFCEYMCPPGDAACTKEKCMETVQKSKLKPVTPQAQALPGQGQPPAVAPGQPAQPVNRPLIIPSPSQTNCVQSGCCVKRGDCKPNCMTTREACL